MYGSFPFQSTSLGECPLEDYRQSIFAGCNALDGDCVILGHYLLEVVM